MSTGLVAPHLRPRWYVEPDGLKPIRSFQDVQERRQQIAAAYDGWWARARVVIRDGYIGGDFVGNGPAWGQTLYLHNFYRSLGASRRRRCRTSIVAMGPAEVRPTRSISA